MRILLLAILTVFWSIPAQAGGLGDMTADERTAFRAEIRAYLLETPEVLMEAIAVLEQRQQQNQVGSDQEMVAANAAAIFDDGFSYVGGNLDGDITLVEFLDYRCSYCRKAHADVAELIRTDGNIRFVIKEFPILGEQSDLASMLAVATLHKAGPDAYLKLNDILMTFGGNLTTNTMTGILNSLGVEPEPILAYMDDDAVKGHIAKVNKLAQNLQITGTPTFVVGKDMLRGYVPLANMRDIVADIRRAKN